MRPIQPNLWFVDNAEEACDFYLSVFPDSAKLSTNLYTEAGPGIAGTPVSVSLRIGPIEFVLINGGPHDQFNDAISLLVPCQDQAEVDYFWEKLTDGGHEVQCGWLKDRFGVSWQVVPDKLIELMADPDRARVSRMIEAMFQMKKLDVDGLEAAFRGD